MKRIDVVENVSAAIAHASLARAIAALPPQAFENLRIVLDLEPLLISHVLPF